LLGEEELLKGKGPLKDMDGGSQEEVPLVVDDICVRINAKR
jgi:hypothetical protein